MALYFLFHAKTSRLKRENNWGANFKQVRITDIAIRTADEMLPSVCLFITNGDYNRHHRIYGDHSMQIYQT